MGVFGGVLGWKENDQNNMNIAAYNGVAIPPLGSFAVSSCKAPKK